MAFRIQSALIFLFLSGSIFACGEAEITKQPQVNSPSQATEASWQKVQGEGITLNLPPGFAGGNPSTDINVLEEQLKTVAPDYENKIELLKQNPGAVALLAFDTQSAPQQGVTSINVRLEKLDAELTVEDYLEIAKEQISPTYEIEEERVTAIDGRQAGRILAEAQKNGTQIKQLFYVLQDGETFWLVTYSTTAEEFEKRLPDFEKSIQSIKLET
ncbi:MAG: hypothetical protein WA999_02670 [Spirulinaceae cyanobacterium]